MSFQVGLTELERAREVAERALRTIEMGQETERFNVWAALLNFEKVSTNSKLVATSAPLGNLLLNVGSTSKKHTTHPDPNPNPHP